MIVTDDDRIADLCRSMRNQGRDSAAWLSHARLGYNYRMSEITGALGEAQMRRLDEMLQKRRRVAEMYRQALGEIGEIHLPPMADGETASWFVYVIRLADEFTQDQRDGIMAYLKERGVSCAPYFVPIHLQPYAMEMLGTKAGDFPVTERIAARTIALPFSPKLTEGQVARVRQTLVQAIHEHR